MYKSTDGGGKTIEGSGSYISNVSISLMKNNCLVNDKRCLLCLAGPLMNGVIILGVPLNSTVMVKRKGETVTSINESSSMARKIVTHTLQSIIKKAGG